MSRSLTSIELVDHDSTHNPTPVTNPPRIKLKSDGIQPLQDDASSIDPPANGATVEAQKAPGKGTTAIVLVTVVCVTAISTLLAGLITVALPTLARDLELEPSLLLWYVYQFVSYPYSIC